MSNAIITTLVLPIDRSFMLLEQFIDVCPDTLWKEKFGGWPLWQQVYHVATAINYFVLPANATMPEGPFAASIGHLAEVGTQAPEKSVIVDYFREMKKTCDEYVSSLTDADLATVNAGFTQRAARGDLSHGMTLATIATHGFYHLGSCDAALRQNGFAGVY